MNKNLVYLKFVLLMMILLSMQPVQVMAAWDNIEFSSLTNRDGLSNSQVKAILKDQNGYVWLGTQSGLNRFDGFRMKTFLYNSNNKSSLPNNSVDQLQQDYNGNIWVRTSIGYCIYNYNTEQFDRKPEEWLKGIQVMGPPFLVLIDKQKDMWFFVYGQGCYYHSAKTKNTYLFKFTQKPKSGCLLDAPISDVCELNGDLLVTYTNGTLARVNGDAQRVVWYNTYLKNRGIGGDNGAYSFVDNKGCVWVSTNKDIFVLNPINGQWKMVREYLAERGIQLPLMGTVIVHDVATDKKGNLWVATDHDGLFRLNYSNHSWQQFLHAEVKGSIVDNSLQKIFVDEEDGVWIGSYKNGVAYYSPASTKFNTIQLGDICTITQDLIGNLWCGTNDSGIICYNPITGQSWRFGRDKTGLTSDVIVSSVTMQDGTMYFGTYNGGLTQYKDGRWKAFRMENSELANNSVWCLAETPQHQLMLGTLGSGFQVFDPSTEKFTTYNIDNSGITSNFINSIKVLPSGQALIAHSQNYSLFDFQTRKVTNVNTTKDGMPFDNPSFNMAFTDSRGILWVASSGGIMMYDAQSGQRENINELNGTLGAVGCAVLEDLQNNIWLVSEFIVTRVSLSKDEDGKWNLTMTSFNSLDGLQNRQFNQRSICLMHNGAIAIGGQDGINIINPRSIRSGKKQAHVLFSGLVLFDHPLTAGEEFEGRVPLKESLDFNQNIELSYKDKAFTIQLASSEVTLPARARFRYRMKGLNDKWMITAEGRPEVTFTNLSSGSYVLQVKVVNADGSVSDEMSELKIHIHPPFYLSTVAIVFYILLVIAALWYYRYRMMEKQRVKYELQSKEDSIKKTKEVNELKLTFFTNVSHELRTPLTLIISPLVAMIRDEENPAKRRKLELIHRNATRLLNLVNQILDFRKFDQNKEKLTKTRTDIVAFVDNICNSFSVLANNKVTLSFESYTPKLYMNFDPDKVGKIVNNLLSNAYKFTPDGGSIKVSLDVGKDEIIEGNKTEMIRICVADTGKGISDEEKKHIFERFYQVDEEKGHPQGGSGIGLNLVKKFSELHGGKVDVKDNPGGGTIFVVKLPIDRSEPIVDTESNPPSVDALYSVHSHNKPEVVSMPNKNVQGKVLLVDDSDDFREFMRDVLSDYLVVEAVNGKDAWQKIIDDRPDIILSDVMMPEMDGNELCRMVKENDDTASIPFVMLTARLASEHHVEGLANGADDYITKPFNIDMLNLRIRNLLGWARRTAKAGAAKVKANGPVIPKGELGDMEMTDADRKFLEQVDIYIRDNMSDPDTSVESMSAHLSISRVQLYKRMVSLTGTTPSEYLRSKRITYAEHLMQTEDLNVSEIAYKVGFNTPRYFSKYFQEAYGVTPSQYMKNL